MEEPLRTALSRILRRTLLDDAKLGSDLHELCHTLNIATSDSRDISHTAPDTASTSILSLSQLRESGIVSQVDETSRTIV